MPSIKVESASVLTAATVPVIMPFVLAPCRPPWEYSSGFQKAPIYSNSRCAGVVIKAGVRGTGWLGSGRGSELGGELGSELRDRLSCCTIYPLLNQFNQWQRLGNHRGLLGGVWWKRTIGGSLQLALLHLSPQFSSH